MTDESIDSNAQSGTESTKAAKAKPTKVLPTDRLNFEKQLSVLRGYAAASGADRKAVSNRDVGAIVQIHENTVSICNPFLLDLGLLSKDGQRSRPSDEIADYAQAFEWDSEKAAYKLAPNFRKAWFSTALIPKLTFRPLSKDEATTFLANEAKAPKEYKANLEIILDYLKAAGVIQFDGANYTLGPNARESSESPNGGGKTANGGTQEITPPLGALNTHNQPAVTDSMPPFIRGLIDKLPEPDSDWSLTDRAKWLTTAANIFDLMYKDDDLIGLTVTVQGSTLSIKKGQS